MQDQELTLFHANWSFCSQMVRVALFELNVNFNEQHIRLCDQYAEGENLDKNFLSLNSLATVPVMKFDNEIIVNSTTIIEELNKRFQGNLHEYVDNSFVKQTTITEGDKFASTIGTIIPVFSAPLIEFMVRKLPFKSIMKIFFKHPRKDRKFIFLSMYFFGVAKKFPNIAIKKFVDEILKFEEKLSEDNTYFTNKFSHIDINMMCVFNRLEDLKLGKTIETSKTPLLLKYWNNLKKRESYQRGILNYYTDKEHSVIKDFYKDKPSPYLDLILDEIVKRN
tara:strand:+ start:1936 stop:2772 length:837 start_codon:yes stop_codon:yes gene_type:complete